MDILAKLDDIYGDKRKVAVKMNKGYTIIKLNSRSQKFSQVLKLSIAVTMLAILVVWLVSAFYAEDINAGLAQNIVRLHVIANSDSDADQALKLKVRDAVIEYMKSELSDSKNIEQTKVIINKDLNRIQDIAREVIAKENQNYAVTASIGYYPFPTKTYGDITLPAGNYDALRVVIGKGEGRNWWCVLFPPLCFIDATHGTIPESVKMDLKESLSDEEYAIITSTDKEEDIPIKIKFKVVEFLEGTKIKFTGAISKLFN